MRRGIKIALIVFIVAIVLIGISIPIYLSFTNKTAYHVVEVEKTEYTVADFVDNSELQLYKNGTFHITIQHKSKGLSLTGIGTYQLEGNDYHLKFKKLFARDNNSDVVDYTDREESKTIVCTRSGNRIKSIDHKAQTFYFG